ncbi:MAG TPA: hypothetical protein VGU22_05125 [Methylomirabilota bacterium]|jgi:translation initiation factor IF-1|nr:hypothetical protein [Methylomirabilota bacterium]
MTFVVALFTAVAILLASAAPASAQTGQGGLGGVLDALGGILGGVAQKLHGTVVLARDTTLVLRGDDERSYRIDLASIAPQARQSLRVGETATVSVRGGGQAGVLTATDLHADPSGAPKAFRQVAGTIEEGGNNSRIVFRTRDGLSLPIDVSQLRGLPFFSANDPATLIYEHGPQQQIVAVWVEPGQTQPAASAPPSSLPWPTQPSASIPARGVDSVQGTVNTIGLDSFSLQTREGRTVMVEARGVDRRAVQGIRPGDVVTVTGQAETPDRFVAQSIRMDQRGR